MDRWGQKECTYQEEGVSKGSFQRSASDRLQICLMQSLQTERERERKIILVSLSRTGCVLRKGGRWRGFGNVCSEAFSPVKNKLLTFSMEGGCWGHDGGARERVWVGHVWRADAGGERVKIPLIVPKLRLVHLRCMQQPLCFSTDVTLKSIWHKITKQVCFLFSTVFL